jgi:DeoR/GlpR family transcriptional regulator of sugar metabolism
LPNGQNVHLGENPKKTTAQELGEYFNVDEKTIRRDAEFAKGLERLDPVFRKEVLNGKAKLKNQRFKN